MMLQLTGTYFRLNAEFGGGTVDAEGALQEIVFNSEIVDSQLDTSLDPSESLQLASKSAPSYSAPIIELEKTVKDLGDVSVIGNKDLVNPEVNVMQTKGVHSQTSVFNLIKNLYN
jgi:hypothetical protein